MRFDLQLSAMNADDATLALLDQILRRVEVDVHLASIKDADRVEDSRLFKTSRPMQQRFLRELAKNSGRPVGHPREFTVKDPASAVEGQRLAYSPLSLVVENAFSDRALIEAVVRKLGDPWLVELFFGAPSREDPPAVFWRGAGGHGQVSDHVDDLLNEASTRGRAPRIVVVTDSDGEWRGHVETWAAAIQLHCRNRGISCHVLKQRTAENYIPDEVWDAWAKLPAHRNHRGVVVHLKALSGPFQRAHLRMGKAGTPPWDSSNPECAKLFRGVNATTEAALKAAHLKGRGEDMKIKMLSTYDADYGEAELRRRDEYNELDDMITLIANEI
ncbi:MAG: hypothetical protein H6739_32345 [Alphaproteobacteria bacterium]|nr:hypothetical protein [Alphaproteobacteria bacterium]